MVASEQTSEVFRRTVGVPRSNGGVEIDLDAATAVVRSAP